MVGSSFEDAEAAILSVEQRESSFLEKTETPSKKKKGLFSVFKRKQKDYEKFDAKTGTAPNTPDNMNVSVLASEYDPAKPYMFNASASGVSADIRRGFVAVVEDSLVPLLLVVLLTLRSFGSALLSLVVAAAAAAGVSAEALASVVG